MARVVSIRASPQIDKVEESSISKKIEISRDRVRVVTSYGEPVREEGGKEGARATGC